MYMIINVGSGNSSVSAENVKYGDSNVANTLDTLKLNDSVMSGILGSIDTTVNTMTGTVNGLTDSFFNMSGAIGVLENELTANGKRIYLDYKDGKYGYNTSATRGADTFSPFKSGSDGQMIPYLEIGTSDTASAECSLKLSCKGCTILHIDSIVQTNGTNYGSISFENGERVQTQLDKPQYNYEINISEWASSNDLIELYFYTYKCRFNVTNVYCK